MIRRAPTVNNHEGWMDATGYEHHHDYSPAGDFGADPPVVQGRMGPTPSFERDDHHDHAGIRIDNDNDASPDNHDDETQDHDDDTTQDHDDDTSRDHYHHASKDHDDDDTSQDDHVDREAHHHHDASRDDDHDPGIVQWPMVATALGKPTLAVGD
jgi:hypothetical protein